MKKLISNITYDFIHHVRPKWKFFGTIILTLTVIDVIFYFLTHSTQGVANPEDHAFNYVLYSVAGLMNPATVYLTFKEYVQKDFLRIRKNIMESFHQEIMMKDETLYKLSDLYNETPDYLKKQFVSILFESALIKENKNK